MARSRPIILGIVGDSAAGKSTITQGLVNILGAERVTHVCTDDYTKYDRKERAALGVSALHPDCNYLDVLELHLERLAHGHAILKPVYDHATGNLVRSEYVQPREFVIVEGLLGFHTAVMRRFYDVKVYLDPPEPLHKIWKIKRDTTRRGYTTEQVLQELVRRERDSNDYIRPQRKYADIVVSFCPSPGTRLEDSGATLDVQLILCPTISHPDSSYLVEDTRHPDPGIRFKLGRDEGRPVDLIEIDGDISAAHASDLEDAIWKHSPDLHPVREDQFGDYRDRAYVRHSHPLALTQLLLTYHLLRKYSAV